MNVKVSELKPYKFNVKFFDLLPKDVYNPLKADIEKNGIKTDLHILADNTVVCGHQRLRIAKELGLEKVPCKVVKLEGDDAIKEYVIKDNLLRRHLTPEQKALLYGELKKLPHYQGRVGGDRKSTNFKTDKVSVLKGETNKLIGKEFGVSGRTVDRYLQYSDEVVLHPELRGEKITKVLRDVKKEKQVKEIKVLIPPKGKFNVIVVDPPWPGSEGYDPDGFRGAGDYPTMSFDEIKAIKLPTADDCVLWLWGIDLHLKETLEVLESWGFERKSTLIWAKDKFGLGHWLRNQHEYCFLAVKGKPVFHGESISSILNAPRRKHSEKPEEFYALVEKASPYKKKLDYFARKKREGWEVFGDEVDG